MSLKQKHMIETYRGYSTQPPVETKTSTSVVSPSFSDEPRLNSDTQQNSSYLAIDKFVPGRETPIFKAYVNSADDIFPLCQDCDNCTNSKHRHHYFGKDTYCFGCNNHPCYACTYAGVCRIHRMCDDCYNEVVECGEYNNCQGCSYCDRHEPNFKCIFYNQSPTTIAKIVKELE